MNIELKFDFRDDFQPKPVAEKTIQLLTIKIPALNLSLCLGYLWGCLYSLKQPKTILIEKILRFAFVKSENISYNETTTHPLQRYLVNGSLGRKNRQSLVLWRFFHF